MLNLDSAGSPALLAPPLTDADLRPLRRRGPKPPPTPEVLRARIARAIEKLIAAMDALDAAGEDLEPSLGAPERHPSAFGGFEGLRSRFGVDQTHWADGTGDAEEENQNAEDAAGGDVNDEPHDEDTDLELEPDLEPDDDAELDGQALASDAAAFLDASGLVAASDGVFAERGAL